MSSGAKSASKPGSSQPYSLLVNEDRTVNTRVLMTTGSSIDYDAMTQDALRGVVRNVLNQVAKNGLPGDHHFYIAFNTQAPGVVLSRRLKEKYPEEMMVVLQHRFWDLAATEEGFEVKLTFDGIPERLCVPFSSLRVFHDPSVRFTLQFGEHAAGDETQEAPSGRRRRDGGDAGRNAADRRGRTRTRSRLDGSTEQNEQPSAAETAPQAQPQAQPQHNPPAVFGPRAVETKKSAAAPAASEPAAPDSAGQKAGGAKVFSLDQFRKK